MRYNNKDWDLDVVETRDPNDALVPAIRVQVRPSMVLSGQRAYGVGGAWLWVS